MKYGRGRRYKIVSDLILGGGRGEKVLLSIIELGYRLRDRCSALIGRLVDQGVGAAWTFLFKWWEKQLFGKNILWFVILHIWEFWIKGHSLRYKQSLSPWPALAVGAACPWCASVCLFLLPRNWRLISVWCGLEWSKCQGQKQRLV